MNRNSNMLGENHVKKDYVQKEILNWYYENNEDSIIILWDERNQIIHISSNVENWFNHSAKDIIGKKWTDFVSEKMSKKVLDHFKVSKEKLKIPLLPIPSNDKEYSFKIIIDQILIGSSQYYISKMKDITIENKLKQFLQDSEKLVLAGQLSAGLVHEIRNPLTSLKGFLQLIQAGIKQQEKYFHVMINEIDKLEKITSELLHMAKPFQKVLQKENVTELIQDVIFIMSTQTEFRNIHYKTNFQNELFVICDASQIKQVLFNIIKNGAEAMDKSGVINIETHKESNYVAIHILDKGKGISEEIVKELGTPFFTTKSDGTGLGLLITNIILDEHQGKLRISSDEKLGTNFTILLPLANDK